MFRVTYKNTLKTLLRSWTFWIALAVYLLILVSTNFGPQYAEGNEPEVLSLWEYNQYINNLIYMHLTYALPIFAVISTVLVLNRDYGDQFFEIEKAAGYRQSGYFFGRLSAIVTLQLAVLLLECVVRLHVFVAGRGGVEGLSFGAYLADSAFRLLYTVFGGALPCLLFYVGLTYMVGSLFRNGVAAATAGFGYTLLFFVLLMFKVVLTRIHQIEAAILYFDYFCHMPDKLRDYLHFWNIEGGQEYMMMFGFETTLGSAALCIAILCGFFAIFTAVSWLRLRKRET